MMGAIVIVMEVVMFVILMVVLVVAYCEGGGRPARCRVEYP